MPIPLGNFVLRNLGERRYNLQKFNLYEDQQTLCQEKPL
jgi:hypothetical protein